MAIITPPPTNSPVDRFNSDGKVMGVSNPFTAWFQSVFLVCFGLSQSGTTAQRPTTNLWVGRMYFDTSLGASGKPIWYSGSGWVLADGTAA